MLTGDWEATENNIHYVDQTTGPQTDHCTAETTECRGSVYDRALRFLGKCFNDWPIKCSLELKDKQQLTIKPHPSAWIYFKQDCMSAGAHLATNWCVLINFGLIQLKLHGRGHRFVEANVALPSSVQWFCLITFCMCGWSLATCIHSETVFEVVLTPSNSNKNSSAHAKWVQDILNNLLQYCCYWIEVSFTDSFTRIGLPSQSFTASSKVNMGTHFDSGGK